MGTLPSEGLKAMWNWCYRLCRRIEIWWDDRQQRKINAWLKAHPDRIKIDEKRLKEWNRKRD